MSDWEMIGKPTKPGEAKLKAPKSEAEWEVIGKPARTIGSSLKGGALAAGDFASQVVSMVPAGITGIGAGLYEGLKSGSAEKGLEAATSQIERVTKAGMPSTYIDVDPRDREFVDKVLAAPAELGGYGMRGAVGLSKAIGHGSLEAGAEYIRHPESDPLMSAAADTAGMFAGYGAAHKGIVRAGTAITPAGKAQLRVPETYDTKGPEAFRSQPPTGTETKYSPYRTRKEEAKAKKKEAKEAKEKKWERIGPELTLEPMIEPPKAEGPGVMVDGELASLQPPGQRPLTPLMRDNRTGEKIPVQEEPRASDGTIDYGLPEAPLYPTDPRVEVNKANPNLIAEANRAKEAEQAQMEALKPDLNEPIKYDLTLEEPQRVGERERERDQIYENRLDFPTEDIKLKLEKAEKDTHLKNKVKELENLERKIAEQERQAGQEAAEGSRVRQGEVDRTKKSKQSTDKTDRLIEEDRKKRDKVKEQVTARLLNKHPGIDIRVNINEQTGMPELSLYESDKRVNALPEKTQFDTTLSRTLMDSIEFTKDKIMREVERTEPPNMQRSPEVPEQTRPVQRTFVPKKQRGAINPEVFKEGFEKIKELASGLELRAKFIPYSRRLAKSSDFADRGNLNIEAYQDGKRIGGASFAHDRSFEGNLQSAMVGIDEGMRGKGISDEIYKFASELGNDIVPSKVQTKAGQKMWENFEKRGLSNQGRINRQRGATDFGITGALGKLLSKSKTAAEMRAELGYETEGPKEPRSKTHRDVLSSVIPSEPRTLDQFFEDTTKQWDQLQDIPETVLNKVLQPNSVGALSQRYNPFIRFMNARLDAIDRKIRTEKEDARWGTAWKQGLRGWERRTRKSDDGARTILDTLKPDRQDLVRKTLVEFSDGKELMDRGMERPSEEMLRDRGLNDREIKSVNAIYDVFDKLLDRANRLLDSLGMDQIKKRPGFFPSVWMGDYRVFVKDPETGKVISAFGAQTRGQMKRIAKDMQERHPEYTISIGDAGRNKYKMNDMNAFRLALDVLDSNSPAAKILEDTYKDIVAHRGFKTHALEKKGAGGFLGTEEGAKGVREMEKAIDIYIDKAYNFIGELEKKTELANLKNKFAEKDQRIPGKFPNTNEYLNEMTANSTGAIKNGLEAIDAVLESTGKITGFGPTAAKRAIGNVSGAASVFWLTTGKFLEVQLLQPLYNFAKMRELKTNLDTGSIMNSFMHGYMESFVPKMASAETKAALSWAKRNGFIDAKMMDLMGMNLSKGIWVKRIMNELPKHTLGWWEQEVVRTPTFVAYNHLLRDAIPDAKERWEAAGALTDKYMVDYSRTQSPAIYSKLGVVGDAARPLKQYTHAYAGQLSEYTARAVHDKQFAPLGTFLGVQWTLAGIKGLVPLAVAATAINTLNDYLHLDIPTPEEVLMGSGLSDTMTFGPISTLTGQDLSGSMGAPDPTQLTALPGIDFAKKIATEGGGYLGKKMQGLDTPQDEMSALLATTPRAAHPFIEQAYTPEGEGVPNLKGRPGLSDVSPRTQSEWNIAKATTARPIREASEKASIRSYKAKGQRLREKKALIMNKLLSDITSGQGISEDLQQKWVAAGGDPREWKPAIKQYLIDKNMSFAEREMMSLHGLSALEKTQRLEKFRLGLEHLGEQDLVEITKEMAP